MGKHMLRLLKFAIKYPGWHSWAKGDTAAINAVRRLVNHGLLEINDCGQFRLKDLG